MSGENSNLREPAWVRIVDTSTQIASWASGVSILLMGLNIVFDVALRNLIRTPIDGTNDLVTFLWMPCLALLALGYAEISGEQISVTILLDGTSERAKKAQAVLIQAITAAVAAWMTYLAVASTLRSYQISESVISIGWLHLWPIRAAAAISFAIFTLSAVVRLYRIFPQRPLSTEVEQEMST